MMLKMSITCTEQIHNGYTLYYWGRSAQGSEESEAAANYCNGHMEKVNWITFWMQTIKLDYISNENEFVHL
jgi:hypothetical protein